MKKVFMIIAAACFCVAANAQVLIGGNLGFGITSNNGKSTTIINNPSSTTTSKWDGDRSTSFQIAPKIGYQLNDRMSFGVTIGYILNRFVAISEDPSNSSYVDYYSKAVTSMPTFYFSTYFRYAVAKFGKGGSFFLEASVPHAWNMATKTHTETDYTLLGTATHNETDVTSPTKTFRFKFMVTPGFSYAIGKHCSVDLYLDLASIAYQHNRTTTYVESSVGSNEKIDNTHQFYIGVNGLPEDQLFRLGFNYVF